MSGHEDDFPTEEDLKYEEIKRAMKEEERLQGEIDKIFAAISDRTEAEKIVLRDWAPQLDAAQYKTGQFLREWFSIMEREHEREEQELTGGEA